MVQEALGTVPGPPVQGLQSQKSTSELLSCFKTSFHYIDQVALPASACRVLRGHVCVTVLGPPRTRRAPDPLVGLLRGHWPSSPSLPGTHTGQSQKMIYPLPLSRGLLCRVVQACAHDGEALYLRSLLAIGCVASCKFISNLRRWWFWRWCPL